jgi:hypothetical protein
MRIIASLALVGLFIAPALSGVQGQQSPVGQAPAGGQRQGRGGGGMFKQPDPYDFDEHEGWTSLFAKTLNGWSGDSNRRSKTARLPSSRPANIRPARSISSGKAATRRTSN